MRRLFGYLDDGEVRLTSSSVEHAKVIRLELNEEVEILTSDGIFLCEVSSLKPIEFNMVKKLDIDRELKTDLVLFCPLLKGDKFEFLLQKTTELGVKTIVPFISSRVIRRVTKDEFEKKRNRYEKIISEAVLQSNRNIIPTLEPLHNLKDLLKYDADYKYIAYEDEALKGKYFDNLDLSTPKKVILMFGPEGGYSKEEVQLFVDNGFDAVSLGKRILRAETACLYMLSVIGFKEESNE